ncbi:MAG: MFS transporter [Burkholderiales bacterium]|nr:MFS transporter [Burkholderiales bacterium]
MRLTALVAGLGIAQIISWGTLFYAIGVLGAPMRRSIGVSELFLFSAFTGGLLVCGSLAPLAGRSIDRFGGRVVLSAGSLTGALAMAVLATASHPALLVLGWLLAGAAMAACLYDPAFATLAQHAGPRYRRAVTALTLFGGFASTAFWPLSHLLNEAWGWRATFGIYTAMHLLVCLPVHWLLVPQRPPRPVAPANAPQPALRSPAFSDPRLAWLTASFAIVTFVGGVIAVHMVGLLTHAGLTTAQAVSISMLVGPMQVAGRIIEMSVASRVRSVTVGAIAFMLLFVGIVSLTMADGMGVAAILFVVAYGCGNGVVTIVKGTTPAELFGAQGLGGLLGHLSRAAFYAKALAPAAFSGLVTFGLTQNAALATLAAIALAGLGCYAMASRAPAPVTKARSSSADAR